MHWLVEHLDFTLPLLQIVAIDLLLGGDNAIVIAMACRMLPAEHQKKAILLGTVGAVLARIILLVISVQLLALPWLKAVGAILLLWIGCKLVANDEEEEEISADSRLWKTVLTIMIADVLMSLDNVLAVAAAGKGNLWLVSLGVAISIPIIVLGSKVVLRLLACFPVMIKLGGALIGWIAGSMLVTDNALLRFTGEIQHLPLISGMAGVLLVLLSGCILDRS
ncbi:TerC family protein [Buttiauxella sp. B2]|uniref:TerC family protein n=1 Tax=Buttiauxella sp. B2 TaxID=2587812 RepID=UPI00111D0E00|nr:TerC family protein [Buttiauxella sp. B2]TNV10065.1 TerC family protein [Buttiauxella sp. B2]